MAQFSNNNTGNFTTCSNSTKDFVLNQYLAAKIARLRGMPIDEILGGTPVRIDSPYANDEGVIHGFEYEKGLRVDLQKPQNHGNLVYATWQVQWGTGMKNNKGGAYAGVLMRTDTDFNFFNFKDAMKLSFQWGKYCRLDP
jgi:hypothetical protein